MLKTSLVAAIATIVLAGTALADPIEGNYRTPKSGATAHVAPCGSSFCMTYVDGQFQGKQFAVMSRAATARTPAT